MLCLRLGPVQVQNTPEHGAGVHWHYDRRTNMLHTHTNSRTPEWHWTNSSSAAFRRAQFVSTSSVSRLLLVTTGTSSLVSSQRNRPNRRPQHTHLRTHLHTPTHMYTPVYTHTHTHTHTHFVCLFRPPPTRPCHSPVHSLSSSHHLLQCSRRDTL